MKQQSAMTVIRAISSFREPAEMSTFERASLDSGLLTGPKFGGRRLEDRSRSVIALAVLQH